MRLVNSNTQWLAALALSAALSGCAGLDVDHDYPENSDAATQESGSLFDWFKLDIFADEGAQDVSKEAMSENADDKSDDESSDDETTENKVGQNAPGVSGLAINADLWRAALDTVRFMPLAAADPTGGTIITDWYKDSGSTDERVKINVVISGMELRADALRVSLFREKWRNNRWVGLAASARAERQMENIILTRARDFVIARRNAR